MRLLTVLLLAILACASIVNARSAPFSGEASIISELEAEISAEEASAATPADFSQSPAILAADQALLEVGAISQADIEKPSGSRSSARPAAARAAPKASKAAPKRTSAKKRSSGLKRSSAKKRSPGLKPKKLRVGPSKRKLKAQRRKNRRAKNKAYKSLKAMKSFSKNKKLGKAAKKLKKQAKKAMLKALAKLKAQFKERQRRQDQKRADALVARQRREARELANAMKLPSNKQWVPRGAKRSRAGRRTKRRTNKKTKKNKKKLSAAQLKKKLAKKAAKRRAALKAKKAAAKKAAWAKKQAAKNAKLAKKAQKAKDAATKANLKKMFGKLHERADLQKAAESVGKVSTPAAPKRKAARKMRMILPAVKPRVVKSHKAVGKCNKKSVLDKLRKTLAWKKKEAMKLHKSLERYQKFGPKMRWNIIQDGTGSGLNVPPNIPKKDPQALKDMEKLLANVHTLHMLGSEKWSIAEEDLKKGRKLQLDADNQRERFRDFQLEQQAEMLTPEGWAETEVEPDVYNEFEPIH